MADYKIINFENDSEDYVSTEDAIDILGLSSVRELLSLGRSTARPEGGKNYWHTSWIVSFATDENYAQQSNIDSEWINEYMRENSTSDGSQSVFDPSEFCNELADPKYTNSDRLSELLAAVPPPADLSIKFTWDQLEKVTSQAYPDSFKRFIAAYGTHHWYGFLQPAVLLGDWTMEEFEAALTRTHDECLSEGLRAYDGHQIVARRFDEPGGWLPFIWGTNSDVYCWITIGDSSGWYVAVVDERSYVALLPPISMTEMFLSWRLGEPPMEKIWGSVSDFRTQEPEAFADPFSAEWD